MNYILRLLKLWFSVGRGACSAGMGAALLFSGCGIVPSIPAYTYANHKADVDVRGIEFPLERASDKPPIEDREPNIFVGVAISGGGSRAASFATGILQELDEMGFLTHVKTISSVSGGGLAASYFALHGSEIQTKDDWESVYARMRVPFRSKAILHYLLPQNLILSATTDFTRTNVMADVLNDSLFHDATFADLGKFGPRRPTLMINATEITSSAARGFTFTSERFRAYGSTLSSYRIADAVMASAAFPGAFEDVTLKQWPRKKPNGTVPVAQFVRLMDGGPADNLGIIPLMRSVREYSVKNAAAKEHRGPLRCFIFVVDAYVEPPSTDVFLKRSIRSGPLNYLISSNVLDAFDALLLRNRNTTLEDFGIVVPTGGGGANPHEFFYTGEEALSRGVYSYDRVRSTQLPSGPRGESPECTLWHLPMTGVDSLRYTKEEIEPVNEPIGEARHPVLKYRTRLWHVVNRIKTDFNLTGPRNCSAEFLQDSLRQAAHVLVRDDHESLKKACQWFTDSYPEKSFCNRESMPFLQMDVPINLIRSEKTVVSDIECINTESPQRGERK